MDQIMQKLEQIWSNKEIRVYSKPPKLSTSIS